MTFSTTGKKHTTLDGTTVKNRYNNKLILIKNILANRLHKQRMRWAGNIARMEEGRNGFTILTGKFTGKRPLGRPRRRWEDNIRMNLEEIGINAGELG